jgi:hypothetical protein
MKWLGVTQVGTSRSGKTRPEAFSSVLLVRLFVLLHAGSPARAQIVDHRPAPVIATSADGIPIRFFGDLYVYDVSPEF